eukprot:CAMPEP_0201593122 /NCGR_PEP_ID=MMETSP0190_2-20130828/190834_1 /ASSEMBLY_ACC=CAM_ASM_000263 /TAXON_ID=37353 /ORGANISM="Rosalina sp." /LENGTH=106 /DNA_ID=CAMNT_0048052215 /DNA_START=946 /DNA_END=1266 /DNA_ORIENTATION=-
MAMNTNGQQQIPSNTDGQMSYNGSGGGGSSGTSSGTSSTKHNAVHSNAASTTMTRTVLSANNSQLTATTTQVEINVPSHISEVSATVPSELTQDKTEETQTQSQEP